MFSITVKQGDILSRPCDLLVLKHADGFFGVDAHVASHIGFSGSVPQGRVRVLPGRGTDARHIAFIGVGPLVEFGYSGIRKFGKDVIDVAHKRASGIRRICMPIHGPGYGLDEAEAFSSLIAGLVDGAGVHEISSKIDEVEIVEINSGRAKRCAAILRTLLHHG